jgi:hypothetical protein
MRRGAAASLGFGGRGNSSALADLDRNEQRATALRQRALAHLTSPGEEQTRIQVIAGSDIADPGTGSSVSAMIRNFSSTAQRRRR